MNTNWLNDASDIKHQHYLPHLKELINKTRISAIVFLLCCCMGYYIGSSIISFLIAPIYSLTICKTIGCKMIYTNISDGFVIRLNVAGLFGAAIALPFFLFQLCRFASPGLYLLERRIMWGIFITSHILLALSCIFVYALILPKAWNFFYSFVNIGDNIEMLPNLSQYISLTLRIFIGFAVAFQFPLIIVVMNLFGLITIKTLVEYRRLAILFNFILSGIITPPDILSQLLLAIPLTLMYEFAIIACKLLMRKSNRKSQQC